MGPTWLPLENAYDSEDDTEHSDSTRGLAKTQKETLVPAPPDCGPPPSDYQGWFETSQHSSCRNPFMFFFVTTYFIAK